MYRKCFWKFGILVFAVSVFLDVLCPWQVTIFGEIPFVSYIPCSQYICRNVLSRIKDLWRKSCCKKVVVVLKEGKESSEVD